MDLKAHFSKIREMERSLAGDAVIVSVETADGGKAGVKTEVPAAVAARMVVEGRARLASAEESAEFHARKTQAKKNAERRDGVKVVELPIPSGKK